MEVGAGEAIFINATVIHRITKIGTCRYRSFIFPASFLSFFPGSPAEDLVTRVTENQDIRLIRFSADTDWNREVLERLTSLYKLEDQAKDETYAYEVLIELARLWLVLVRNLRQYLREYRLQRGGELLAKTDLPIGAIAESEGFAQMSYFGQSFKNKTGLSPSAYRRAKRQNERDRLSSKAQSE